MKTQADEAMNIAKEEINYAIKILADRIEK